MEWRIFVPLLNDDDLSVIGPDLFSRYMSLQRQVLADFAFGGDIEHRADEYVIGRPHFGLKMRAGKKAEVKVRVQRERNGSELWIKYKLGTILSAPIPRVNLALILLLKGKKELPNPKYTAEVCEILREHGIYEPGDEEILKSPRFLSLEKRREVRNFEGIKNEMCYISSSSSSSSDNDHSQRKWLSVALEGSCKDIVTAIPTIYPPSSSLWALLSFSLKSFPELSAAQCYTPMLCGYPEFVAIIGGFRVIDHSTLAQLIDEISQAFFR